MKILISSRSFGKIDSSAIEYLKVHQLEIVINPYGRKMTEQEILSMSKDIVGIIAGTEKITKKIIDNSPSLRVISRYGMGIDNIDLKAAKEKNILIYNTPDTPGYAVAELTLSLILSLLKKIQTMDKLLRSNHWSPVLGNMLAGKTVGIVGLGRIGKNLVQLLKPFNTTIIACDIKCDKKFEKENNIRYVSFEFLLANADIISLHVPLTNETRHLISKDEINKMKKISLLINTARGGIIDEYALFEALKERRIAGAALDVFENEPNIGKLDELENIILTPHIATFTYETRRDMELESAKNIIKGLKMVGLK